MKRKRLDEVLMKRGWARDAAEAFVIVTEGRVFVSGQKAISPAQLAGPNDNVEVRGMREYVGRGASKLEAAMEHFKISAEGAVCADVGAATGGFVEVLLRRGAVRVFAIDAGRGKLDVKLREDPRVVVMEGVNVLTFGHLPEAIRLVTIDVSFTSLKLVLPAIRHWLAADGQVIALFKPQYEIEDKSVLKRGILGDDGVRQELLERFRTWLRKNHWQELGFMESPIRGTTGNVEYLFHLAHPLL